MAASVSFSPEVKSLALCSTAKVFAKGDALGCGVLIGIDRLIVPLHVISPRCPEELTVLFSPDALLYSLAFKVLDFVVRDSTLDWAVLQLGKDVCGRFPGNYLPIPKISDQVHQGPFLFSSFDQKFPSVSEGEGESCSLENFCANVITSSGSSGGGYFDSEGNLFAIHLSRSSGLCAPLGPFQKKALYLKDCISRCSVIFKMAVCCPICPPKESPSCAPVFFSPDPCFIEEGKPVIEKQISSNNQIYRCWEWRSGNNGGPGLRGLTVAIPGSRDKPTYKFDVNPHDIKAYNKKQGELYEEAGKQFIRDYELTGSIPDRFEFEAYSVKFIATRE
jgi:hypothetical protein